MGVDGTAEMYTNTNLITGNNGEQSVNMPNVTETLSHMESKESSLPAGPAESPAIDNGEGKTHLNLRRRSPKSRKKPKAYGSSDDEQSMVTEGTKTSNIQRNREQRNQRKQRITSDPDTDSSCDFTNATGSTTIQPNALVNTRIAYLKEFAEDVVYEDNDNNDEEYDEEDSDEEDDDVYDDDDGEKLEDNDYFQNSSLRERKCGNTSSKLRLSTKHEKRCKRKTKTRQFSTQRTYSNESNDGGSNRIISKGQMRGKKFYNRTTAACNIFIKKLNSL